MWTTHLIGHRPPYTADAGCDPSHDISQNAEGILRMNVGKKVQQIMNCPGIWEECACTSIAARRVRYFSGTKIAWDPALYDSLTARV